VKRAIILESERLHFYRLTNLEYFCYGEVDYVSLNSILLSCTNHGNKKKLNIWHLFEKALRL